MAHNFFGIKVSLSVYRSMYTLGLGLGAENSHSSLRPASSRARVGYHGENFESDQRSSV